MRALHPNGTFCSCPSLPPADQSLRFGRALFARPGSLLRQRLIRDIIVPMASRLCVLFLFALAVCACESSGLRMQAAHDAGQSGDGAKDPGFGQAFGEALSGETEPGSTEQGE